MTINISEVRGSTIALITALACVFYVGLLFWGGTTNFNQIFSTLNTSGWFRVIFFVSIGYFLRFVRWHYYIYELGYSVPAGSNFRIFMASFLMTVSPGKVGEAVKSYFLKKEFDVPATPTVAAFFCERFTDVLAMILLSAAGFLLYPHGGWITASIFITQLLVLLLLQSPNLIENWILDPLDSIDFFSGWSHRIRRFYARSGDLLTLKNLGIGTVLAVCSWALEGYCLSLILGDLGVTSVDTPVAIFVFAASILLGAAAMLPGGLGSSEALMVAMLMFFGVSKSSAVSSTFLIRLTTFWYGFILGLIAWIWSTRRIHRLESTTESGSYSPSTKSNTNSNDR